MLTDTALRNLKPKSKIYKVFDRDGLYVTVLSAGTGHALHRLKLQVETGQFICSKTGQFYLLTT